jgi:hypothetical protein
MKSLRHLLVGLVMVLLRKTIFTKKWAQSVDMNHGLNIGGIEVVRAMEGLGKNGKVEDVMMKEMDFTIINVRHNYAWIYGVEIDAKKLLIYLVNHYGRSTAPILMTTVATPYQVGSSQMSPLETH